MHSIWMFNPHHMRKNPVSYSADDENYKEEYPVVGYEYSIAKEGSDADGLYVYLCGIQEELRDMNSLSDPNLNLSENVISFVHQIISIQLKSLVLRMQTLPFLDAMFLALSLPAFGSFLLSNIQTNSATRKGKFCQTIMI